MPTYVYKREDGSTFEIEQRITEDALTTCPTTGQPVSRVISGGTGLIFKGSGFYLTDYARKDSNGKATDAAVSPGSNSPPDSKSATDSDSAPKTDASTASKAESTTKADASSGSSSTGGGDS